MRVKIRVTQAIIDSVDTHQEGYHRAFSCPVAHGAKIALPRYDVAVGNFTIFLDHGYKDIHLPKSAQRFIERFDAGKPVKPFEFTVYKV